MLEAPEKLSEKVIEAHNSPVLVSPDVIFAQYPVELFWERTGPALRSRSRPVDNQAAGNMGTSGTTKKSQDGLPVKWKAVLAAIPDLEPATNPIVGRAGWPQRRQATSYCETLRGLREFCGCWPA